MADADIMARLDALTATLNGIREETGLISRRMDLLATTVDGMIWRNVIPLDGNLLAVSHKMGWIVLPQEEYRFIVHFANGTAGHELGTIAVFEALVRADDTVIDVGAHIGLLSLPLARLVGPQGRVLSLEPNPRSAECLRRMLVCNGMDARSQVLEMAVSDEDALVGYYDGIDSMLGSLLPEGGEQASTLVKAARIDSLIPKGVRIDLIKIDVEGLEPKVVAGMRRVLSENHDVFVIAECCSAHIEKYGMDLDAWFTVFTDAGLNCFVVIDEASGRCRRQDITDLSGDFSLNLLFYAHDNRRQDSIWPLIDVNGSST